MILGRRVAATYVRIWRTYRAWSPTLLALAVVVFVPLGLLDGIAIEIGAASIDDGIELATVALTVGALTMSGLLGEIFFSGAIAISLTHPQGERAPTLRSEPLPA
jgi:hypothetical protein